MKKKARGLPLVQDLALRHPDELVYKHPRQMQRVLEREQLGQQLQQRRKRVERVVRPLVNKQMSPQMKILLESMTLSHFQFSSV